LRVSKGEESRRRNIRDPWVHFSRDISDRIARKLHNTPLPAYTGNGLEFWTIQTAEWLTGQIGLFGLPVLPEKERELLAKASVSNKRKPAVSQGLRRKNKGSRVRAELEEVSLRRR
jgi:hypothetical protein